MSAHPHRNLSPVDSATVEHRTHNTMTLNALMNLHRFYMGLAAFEKQHAKKHRLPNSSTTHP